MTRVRQFMLAAGGTGGHMVPAAALAEELKRRGHRVALISDERGVKFPGLFDGVETHVLPAGRVQGGPIGWYRAGRAMLAGRAQAIELYDKMKPSAVIGFGGYPALPALLAAFNRKIPTAVHEQNAVLGRVNRLVAGKVDAIATSYGKVDRLAEKHRAKVTLTGNPVRDDVLALRDKPYPMLEEDSIFRVLVTGGSQGREHPEFGGARWPRDVAGHVPSPVASDTSGAGRGHRPRARQICRAVDRRRPRDLSADLPEHLAWAHLVIARAGASTIAELTAAGRPAILVPLPTATDDHQTDNAREISEAGGARTIAQSQFTPVELAKQMQKLGLDPEALTNAAARARSCGHPDAARDLADLVERISNPAGDMPIGEAQPELPGGGKVAYA